MATVKDIVSVMNAIAPPAQAMLWDNVGLLVGRENAEVTHVIVALDVTEAVIDEAVRTGAELIVAHHPIIFKGVMSITNGDALGRRLLRLVENGIAVFAAHTNLDVADGGTNDTLCERLGLMNVQPMLYEEGEMAIGRHGYVPEAVTLGAFAAHVRGCLGLDGLRYCGDEMSMVRHVAVCAGSGGKYSYAKQVIEAGCDVYITSDIGFHTAQDALADGLRLIDATHYATEVPVVEVLRKKLAEALTGTFVEVFASECNGQVFRTV